MDAITRCKPTRRQASEEERWIAACRLQMNMSAPPWLLLWEAWAHTQLAGTDRTRGGNIGSVESRLWVKRVRVEPRAGPAMSAIPRSRSSFVLQQNFVMCQLRKWTSALATYILAAGCLQLSIGVPGLGLLNYAADLWGF